jgi:hypothetical protein
MLHHWALIVACEARHLFFVAWWTWYASFLLNWARYSDFCWPSQMWWIPFILWIPEIYAFLSNVIVICLELRHMLDNTWIKARDVPKSSGEGHISGPHLVEVRDLTKSSNEGHIFGPHLVEARDLTKSSDEGHIFGPHIWSKSVTW